jgi:hypothetical protein
VTRNHLRDGIVSKVKVSTVAGEQLTKAQVAIFTQSKAFPAIADGSKKCLAVAVHLTTSGGNYLAVLTVTKGDNFGNGTPASFVTYNIDPATPIPAATNTVIAIYLDGMSALGVVALTGNVIFVYMTNA